MGLDYVKQAAFLYTQVLSLGKGPFLEPDFLKPFWHSFFNDKECFYKNRQLIYKTEKAYQKPFIQGIGTISFGGGRRGGEGGGEKKDVHIHCGHRNYDYRELLFHNNDEFSPKIKRYLSDTEDFVLGYSSKIADQRHYFLCWKIDDKVSFELCSDISVRAKGSVYIHLYPSGYVAIIVHINFDWSQATIPVDLAMIIRESKPCTRNNGWKWSSRLSKEGLTLGEIVGSCVSKLRNSFFEKVGLDVFTLRKNDWHSSVRIFSNITDEKVFISQFELENCEILSQSNGNSNLKLLLLSERTILCIFCRIDSQKGQYNAQKKLSYISALQRFVAYKISIYTDLKNVVTSERERLREIRLNMWDVKRTFKDLLRLSVYDPSLLSIMSDLDGYTVDNRDLDSFSSKFHSSYCKLSGCPPTEMFK